jgi:hypothetical protein
MKTTVEHPDGTKLVPFEGGWKVETELVTGKWYKSGKCLCFYKSEEEQYGFHGGYGDWMDKAYWMTHLGNASTQWTLASEEEVKEALIKEAERRGIVKGVTLANVGINNKFSFKFQPITNFYLHYTTLLDTGNGYAFHDGQWAEILSNHNEKILERIATIEKELEQLKAELK